VRFGFGFTSHYLKITENKEKESEQVQKIISLYIESGPPALFFIFVIQIIDQIHK